MPPPPCRPPAVGQFRDLVETAERNKALRETLKQVLRLTKGWDIARDHVRRAVETDVQLRVYHPDGRTEVGLVFKCGSFNVIDINRPVGEPSRGACVPATRVWRCGGDGAAAGRGGPGSAAASRPPQPPPSAAHQQRQPMWLRSTRLMRLGWSPARQEEPACQSAALQDPPPTHN